ncbi:MAG: protein BatD [Desulfuromusa sp.]|nr:protein BatD [Desulfuromusa sp.]
MAISVQAVADRSRVAVGESLNLELRVTGKPDMEPDLSPLQQNWDILRQSQSSQIQIVNKSISRSVIYNLTLMPKKTGTVIIPTVCFGSDCTIPLPIEVISSSSTAKVRSSSLLLEADISPQKVVVQEQLLLRVRLLRRIDLIDGQLTEPDPVGVATVVKQLGNARSYETQRDGQIYHVIERNYAIFPQESGILQIPALQFDGTVANGTSRFDPFNRQGQRVRRMTQPLRVEVLPLPVDLGLRHWIPATTLKLQDSWQQQIPHFVVGEPVTRTLHLRASGVLAAQLPELELNLPDGFKSYPDQPRREDELNSSGITGLLEQKIALIPTRSGHFQLPEIDLEWWDVATGEWQRAYLKPLSIDVAAAANGVSENTPVASGSSLSAPEKSALPERQKPLLAPVPVAVEATGTISPSASFWPWLSLGLALGWLLSMLLLFRQRRYSQPITEVEPKVKRLDEKSARLIIVQSARKNDPQATRQALRQWCQALYPELSTGAYEQFLNAVDSGLREQLENLDRSLYGSSGQAWSGDVLAKMIVDWQKKEVGNKKAELPDLYP